MPELSQWIQQTFRLLLPPAPARNFKLPYNMKKKHHPNLKLLCPHVGIEAAALDKLNVRPAFGNLAIFQHENLVCIDDRREPVGNA
jgi:hypothetical protein